MCSVSALSLGKAQLHAGMLWAWGSETTTHKIHTVSGQGTAAAASTASAPSCQSRAGLAARRCSAVVSLPTAAGTPSRLPAVCSSKLHVPLVGAPLACSAAGQTTSLARPGGAWAECFPALAQLRALRPTRPPELSVPGLAPSWHVLLHVFTL